MTTTGLTVRLGYRQFLTLVLKADFQLCVLAA